MLRSRPVYRRRSEQDGSGRQAACHQRCSGYRQSRSPAGISHWPSGRRSRSFACRATPCRRSLAGSGGRRRRSPGSYGATPPPEVAAWSIARQQRNGTLREPLAAQSRRSLRSTQLCEPMWRNDWLASSSLRAGPLFLARPCPGEAVGTEGGRTGDGRAPGARSRSPVAFRLTSRTIRPCALATKPSIKRCSCKAEVHGVEI